MLKKPSKKLPGVLSIVSLLAISAASAAGVSSAEKGLPAASPIFQGESILEVTLKTDLPQLIQDRSKSFHSATVDVVDPAARGNDFKMKVSTRGMTSLRNCQFPHIRFKFNPELAKNTMFRDLKQVKIVTHCDNPDAGDSYANEQKQVLIQYTLYRMYSILTDYSFKVRLAKMRYVDATGNYAPFTKYAFFLEPLESVAARHSAQAHDRRDLNNSGISASELNAQYAGLTSAFEFMVGNGDWRLLRGNYVSLLNAEAISGSDINLLVMPYDLDRSGMCNGKFAFHSVYADGGTFPIVGDNVSTIRDIYASEFQGRKMYKYAFSRFREKREEIYTLFNNMESLIDSHYRERTIGHLDRFYDAIGVRNDAELQLAGEEL